MYFGDGNVCTSRESIVGWGGLWLFSLKIEMKNKAKLDHLQQ